MASVKEQHWRRLGPGSQLIVAKTKSARATCAIARATGDIDAHTIGQPQGILNIVGIGPGTSAWRTPDADQAIRRADAVVGYSLYLDIVADVMQPSARVDSDLGAEEDRVRQALNLAAAGKRVALVSSGDAGIYALAALVFECLDSADDPRWNRLHSQRYSRRFRHAGRRRAGGCPPGT